MPRPLAAIRTRAELVFRQRVALAFRALRDRTDAARVVREGVDAVPFDAVLGVRLLGDAMRVFRNTYEAAGDKAAAELKRSLVRKQYNPDQPREPAGSPDGGQWTSDGGGGGAAGGDDAAGGGGTPWAWRDDETRYSVKPDEGSDEWRASLTEDEQNAARSYTMGSYRTLNEQLREGYNLTPGNAELKAHLDSLIDKAGVRSEPLTVWRGIRLNQYGGGYNPDGTPRTAADLFVSKLEVGGSVQMDGYQSASFFTEPVMDASSLKSSPTKGVVFEIRTARGASLVKLSNYNDEGEWLLPSGATYRVRGILRDVKFEVGDYQDTNTRHVVQLDLLDGKVVKSRRGAIAGDSERFAEDERWVNILPRRTRKSEDRGISKADDHEVKVEEWTFDVLNDRGLRFLQQHAAKRVVEIVDATRDALRALLADMHNQGVPALEQAKRIKQVVGLTTRDVRAVENLRERLWDDGMAPARAEKLVARKAAELLAQRALTIARTENAFAASAGQRESWAQAARDGLFDPTEAQRAWMTSEDEQTCPICEPMDGQVVGMNEAFTTGEGEAVDEPPAHPNCRCDVVLRISEGRLAA